LVKPLNACMEAVGGSVMREWRSDFEEAEIAKSAASKTELAQLKAELAQSRAEEKEKLQKRISEASRAQNKLQELEKDTKAKINALNDQIAKANAENMARIKERLVELLADYERRTAKLKQAGALIREALAA
jgi:signal transduction protein with GAF and PtsI domain